MYVVPVLLSSSLAVSAPPAGVRAKAAAVDLVEAVSPRPAGTDAAWRALRHVSIALEERGWSPMHRKIATPSGGWGVVLACRPGELDASVLLIAHTDTVEGVLGGNDNAAAVGVLLTVAEELPETPHRGVCLAFPDAEEVGLRGSAALASAWSPTHYAEIDQVIALDLVGVGDLTWNGLGPAWGGARLRHLLEHAPAEVPWVYRAVSTGMPHMERSDHGPFAARGYPASHLMARPPGGVDWAYHSTADTPDRLEEDTLGAAVEALVALAMAPPLPEETGDTWAFVVPWTGLVVGGGVARLLLGVMLFGAAWTARPWTLRAGVREGTWAAADAIVPAWLAGLAIALVGWGRPLGAALTEVGLLAGLLAFGAWWAWRPAGVPERRRAAGVLVTGAVAIGLAALGHPLLAIPTAAAGLGAGLVGTRVAPLGWLLAAWPAAYFLSPSTLRELDFHHLVPASPSAWAVMMVVLTAPLVTARRGPLPGGRRLAIGMGVAAVLVGLAGRALDPYDARHPSLERRHAPRVAGR